MVVDTDAAAEVRERRRRRRQEQQEGDEGGQEGGGAAASMWDNVYQFSTFQATVAEEFGGESSVGGTQWPGGVRIARYLDNRAVFPEGALAGKRVLELGAGCGLVSVVAAHLGARVLATDKDIVMEVLRDNLSTNGVLHDPDGGTEEGEERYPCGKVVVEELYWGPEASHPAAPFDIAIAAACLYMPKTVPLLLQTLHRLTRPDSLILLASILSKDTLARFCDEAPKWFEIEGRGDDGEVLGVFDGEKEPGEACGEGERRRRRLEPGEVATRVLVLKRKELRPGLDYGLPPAAADEEEEREGAGEEA